MLLGSGDDRVTAYSPGFAPPWMLIDGGAGIDTVVMTTTPASPASPATSMAPLATPAASATTTGNRADFPLSHQASAWQSTRTADGAVLVLQNVERLQFADGSLALDLDGHAGQAARLIGAAFGAPALQNKGLVAAGLQLLGGGWSPEQIGTLALGVAGAVTDIQVVQLLFRNLVGREASAEEQQPLLQLLHGGMDTGQMAAAAARLDITAERIDLVGLGATGLAFG